MKLPLARLGVPVTPKRTLGFAGRAEMLDLWSKLDADKQTILLELARQMVAADGPLIRAGKR